MVIFNSYAKLPEGKRCEKVQKCQKYFRITKILQNYPEKQRDMRCYLKNSGTTLTVEISSSLHKMGKMGRKKKLDEILLPQLVIFSLKNHPQLGVGLLRMVKKNRSRCHLVYGITHPQIIQGPPEKWVRFCYPVWRSIYPPHIYIIINP